MAVKTQKEKIQIEHLIAQESLDKAIESRILLPHDRPEVEGIMDVQGQVQGLTGAIVEDGMEITGELLFLLIYNGSEDGEEEGPLFFWEKTDFSFFFSNPRAQAGMDILLDGNIKNLNFSKEKGDLVNVLVTLELEVKLLEKRELSFLKEVEGLEEDAIIDEEEISPEEILKEGREIIEIHDEIKNDSITHLLYYEARITHLDEEVTNGKVNLSGQIEFSLIGLVEKGLPLVLKEVFDFQKELRLGKSSLQGKIINLTELVKTQAELLDSGSVSLHFLLEAFLKVVKRKRYPVITAIESRRVDAYQEIVNLEEFIDISRRENQNVFHYNLPEEKENLQEILFVFASLKECITQITNGGAKITGYIQASVLYLYGEEEEKIQFITESFVFENFIPLTRAEEGMIVESYIFLRGVEGRILNHRTLEISVTLDEMVKVTSQKEMIFVTDLVVVSPLLEGMSCPSMVLYVIQARDTIDTVARRFGAKKEEILEDNQSRIDDETKLIPGGKLLIRRHRIGAASKKPL